MKKTLSGIGFLFFLIISTTNGQEIRDVTSLVKDGKVYVSYTLNGKFFNTFNVLYDAHKQIILSSDRPPKEITDLQ